MTNKEAAEILQKHIDTYHHQLSEVGWRQMVRMGIARDTVRERVAFKADAVKQIEAYQMAIDLLKQN